MEVFPFCTGFVKRIVSWNSARYEQEYDHTLTCDLMHEEFQELCASTADVDKLDALVDITYVAIGAMWKLGLSDEQIRQAIHAVCDSNDSKSVTKTASHVKANIDKGKDFIRPEPRLQEILDARR